MHLPFFNKKYSLLDFCIFEGATDWHSHILPDVDDGIRTMQDSLSVLSYYEQIGIKDVWLTPHILEDIPNTTQALRQRYSELTDEYHGSIRLHLAAENMVDDLFLERLAADDLLPIGPAADHLLVEFSFMQPPVQLYSTIKKIQDKGYTPIVAHPERYAYFAVEDIEALKRRGCKLQMNVTALTGAYGNHAREKAEKMLSLGMYDLCGSDLHSLSHHQQAISQKSLKKEIANILSELTHQVL